jgi:hypothetical protein
MKRFALFIVPSHDWKSGIPQIPALVSRTQKLHCNSTALDDGDAGNGCARCNSEKSEGEERKDSQESGERRIDRRGFWPKQGIVASNKKKRAQAEMAWAL